MDKIYLRENWGMIYMSANSLTFVHVMKDEFDEAEIRQILDAVRRMKDDANMSHWNVEEYMVTGAPNWKFKYPVAFPVSMKLVDKGKTLIMSLHDAKGTWASQHLAALELVCDSWLKYAYDKKVCECGTDSSGGGFHSTWCPKRQGL